MPSNITQLKKIKVNHFRGLKNIEINIAERLTVICGKNGTSKSTILGMIAQIFNFEKDHHSDTVISHKTLGGKNFKSSFRDHFRFSKVYDLPGTMDVKFEIYDAYFSQIIPELKLRLYGSEDRPQSRPVVRDNLKVSADDNSSRNVTHPLIYLSLKRLMPIAERNKYLLEQEEIEFLNKITKEFTNTNNRLLGKASGTKLSRTSGTIDSAVVHGDNYDHESVSVGEDNTGQILLALYSFQKLKEEYSNYHGGILLIDELDAGLFPAAQLELIKILESFAKKLNLQIIFTTHSPIVIQNIFEKSKFDKKNNKTIYLTDTYGHVEVAEDYSWDKIYADLFIETIQYELEKKIPKTNIYFEDGEAYELFRALIRERNLNKIIEPMKEISLGCKNYLDLIKRKIPEFSRNSIVVFDGDEPEGNKFNNTICLPGALPPDQLLFNFLYLLPADDAYWKNNKIGFTKPVFLRMAVPILEFLELDSSPSADFNLQEIVRSKRAVSKELEGKAREKFKDFYKDEKIQILIKGRASDNPFRNMIDRENEKFIYFQDKFKETLLNVISNNHPTAIESVKEFLKINKV
ncbi:AAA family ATPase [Acinetobacter radioresistens]|uniref:AAA family ATPase n=1 Tax=Acinetobacter radioresistens TaxID=40216 RepID=UPI002004A1EC|nr:AAA family ATPase [Acinetobacter radioresistens]MCK4107927.1 AAA family ATPase [Acinetobacter radioresistens]